MLTVFPKHIWNMTTTCGNHYCSKSKINDPTQKYKSPSATRSGHALGTAPRFAPPHFFVFSFPSWTSWLKGIWEGREDMLVYVLFCLVCPLPTIVTVWGMTSQVRNLAGPPTETYPSLTSQVRHLCCNGIQDMPTKAPRFLTPRRTPRPRPGHAPGRATHAPVPWGCRGAAL